MPSEEIEKQRAQDRYWARTARGETEEAKSDLARLAIIRKQREEAKRKREAEKAGRSLLCGWVWQ